MKNYDKEKAALVKYIRNQIGQTNLILHTFGCPVKFLPEVDFTHPNWEEFRPYFSAESPKASEDVDLNQGKSQ